MSVVIDETRGRRRRAGLLAMPALLVFGVFLVAPMANVFVVSLAPAGAPGPATPGLTLANYARFLTDPFYLRILLVTLRISVGVTLACLVLGFPLALYLSGQRGARRRLLMVALISPLLVGVVVRSYAWTVILGPNGLPARVLGSVLGNPPQILHTELAVIIGMTHVFLAYMVMCLDSALQNIDPAVLRAAANLGAGSLQILARIVLPLAVPGVLSGSLLVFTLSASAFVTPAMLGGAWTKVASYLIYQQTLVVMDWPFAGAIAVSLLAMTMLAVAVYLRAMKRGRLAIVVQ